MQLFSKLAVWPISTLTLPFFLRGFADLYCAFDLCLTVHLQCRQCNKIKTNWMQQITVFIDLQDQLNILGWRSGIFLHTKHTVPRCCPPDREPTTTPAHHTTRCNLQSYAPNDGHSFVRNMFSWSWRSINTVIWCIQLVLILLHCTVHVWMLSFVSYFYHFQITFTICTSNCMEHVTDRKHLLNCSISQRNKIMTIIIIIYSSPTSRLARGVWHRV
jgi:hypothetical protein